MAGGKLLHLDAVISLAIAAITILGSLYGAVLGSSAGWGASAFVTLFFGVRGAVLLQERLHSWAAALVAVATALPVLMFLMIVPAQRSGSDFIVVPEPTVVGSIVFGLMFFY